MPKRSKKTQKTQVAIEDHVIVTFTDDLERAREYETLLKSNDIPAVLKENHDTDQGNTSNIVVLVPEKYLDEAHVVIDSQDAYDDFYDLAFEDDGTDEFDNNILDEEL